ncbi:MAG: hypothetical protein PUP93_19870 [Rhizonema sp. NSF051]|nr:hypothetical protein [Rhizonema sp. NSF051]
MSISNNLEETSFQEEQSTVNSVVDNAQVRNHYLDDHLNGTDKERLLYLRAALVTNSVKNGSVQDVITALTIMQSGAEEFSIKSHPNKHIKKLRALLVLRVQYGLPTDDVVKAIEAIANSKTGFLEEVYWFFVGSPRKNLLATPLKMADSVAPVIITLAIAVGMVAIALQSFKAGYDAGRHPSMYPAIRDYMDRQSE